MFNKFLSFLAQLSVQICDDQFTKRIVIIHNCDPYRSVVLIAPDTLAAFADRKKRLRNALSSIWPAIIDLTYLALLIRIINSINHGLDWIGLDCLAGWLAGSSCPNDRSPGNRRSTDLLGSLISCVECICICISTVLKYL